MENYFINYSYFTNRYYVKQVGKLDDAGLSVILGEFEQKSQAIKFMEELEKNNINHNNNEKI